MQSLATVFAMQYMCTGTRKGGNFFVSQSFPNVQCAGFMCAPLSAERKKFEQLHPHHNDLLLADANVVTFLEKRSKPICDGKRKSEQQRTKSGEVAKKPKKNESAPTTTAGGDLLETEGNIERFFGDNHG